MPTVPQVTLISSLASGVDSEILVSQSYSQQRRFRRMSTTDSSYQGSPEMVSGTLGNLDEFSSMRRINIGSLFSQADATRRPASISHKLFPMPHASPQHAAPPDSVASLEQENSSSTMQKVWARNGLNTTLCTPQVHLDPGVIWESPRGQDTCFPTHQVNAGQQE